MWKNFIHAFQKKIKMKSTVKPLLVIICFCACLHVNAQTIPLLKKASNHPIQYYISLPDNWSPNAKWPVVVVLEEAAKEFRKNAERFIAVRKNMPFIIVAPLITTNGNYGIRDSSIYPYSKAVWDTIDKVSNCKFDMDGLQNIIADVKKNYSGSDKIFLTGFEAGTHLLWALTFQHPELLYAAAPVAGNYRGRCVEGAQISHDDSRTQLPIKNFIGSEDAGFGKKGQLYGQYLEAKNLALSHGYKNISETEIAGKGHEPLPNEVMNYFYSTWQSINK